MDFLATTMRTIPDRHRSLRAVFEHSWQLLSEQEQTVLRKLSIFRGGFEREAAENHQQEDGSIRIPEALQPYTGFDVIE